MALENVITAQGQMDIIHNPRYYTQHQKNLMEAIVNYVWGSSRTDIKDAGNELTENIAMLKELAPSDISNIPEESREALIAYGSVKFGCLEDVRRTGKGYELLAIWMNALYDFAQHTGQL